MIPAEFNYMRVSSVDEAITALGQGGEDAKLLAGGHSLIPLMKLRLAAPALLIDVGGIGELRGAERADGGWRIGALTTHATLQDTSEVRDPLSQTIVSSTLASTAWRRVASPRRINHISPSNVRPDSIASSLGFSGGRPPWRRPLRMNPGRPLAAATSANVPVAISNARNRRSGSIPFESIAIVTASVTTRAERTSVGVIEPPAHDPRIEQDKYATSSHPDRLPTTRRID